MTESIPQADVREITLEDFQANERLREHLSNGERVHPADAQQLQNRFAAKNDRSATNRCYAVFGPKQDMPSAVVYIHRTKLRKGGCGHVPDHDLPGDIARILKGKNGSLADADTAIFYSISSYKSRKLDKAHCGGMDAGEYLIKKTASSLANEGVSTFSTLSPLRQYSDQDRLDEETLVYFREKIADMNDPEIDSSLSSLAKETFTGFRPWLERNFARRVRAKTLFTREELMAIDRLAQELRYESVPKGISYANGPMFDKFQFIVDGQLRLSQKSLETLQCILRDLAAEYLVSSLFSVPDPVSWFHLRNGAYLGNIHVKPPIYTETTRREWESAFGVMVNYVYELDPEKLAARKVAFKKCSKTTPEADGPKLLQTLLGEELFATYQSRQNDLARARVGARSF